MKRTRIKAKELNKKIAHFEIEFSKKDAVELLEDKEKNLEIFNINNEPSFFYDNGNILPTLRLLQTKPLLKVVVVDMGAIKFMIGGADVMRPGITKIDESIKKGEYVMVVDENNHKPLLVGLCLFSGEEMKQLNSGKVIKNIHFIGDELWDMS